MSSARRDGKGAVDNGSSCLVLRPVDDSDPTPKYLQARDLLVDAIRTRVLPPGSKLPSTKEISSLVNISLITAHRALSELARTGLVRREIGRGTFVSDDLENGERLATISIALMLQRDINLDDYYHSTIINSLRRAAEGDRGRVEFFFHDRYDLRDHGRAHLGAICIHPPVESQAEIERLGQQFPTVLLGGSFPATRLAKIDCDNFDGARQAVRHLLDLGHRRFIVLSGPLNLSNSCDRVDGAIAEMTSRGVRLADDELIVSRDAVTLDSDAQSRFTRRLTGPDRPTAVVAGGFYLALGAMQTARQAGLALPDDVSIVGFDDPVSAPLLSPPLTTVRQPLEAMAEQAYDVVCRAVREGGAGLAMSRLPTELVVRGSTARLAG